MPPADRSSPDDPGARRDYGEKAPAAADQMWQNEAFESWDLPPINLPSRGEGPVRSAMSEGPARRQSALPAPKAPTNPRQPTLRPGRVCRVGPDCPEVAMGAERSHFIGANAGSAGNSNIAVYTEMARDAAKPPGKRRCWREDLRAEIEACGRRGEPVSANGRAAHGHSRPASASGPSCS